MSLIRLVFGVPMVMLALTACIGGKKDLDSDGDGLTDREEEDLGLDPNSADGDEDGLNDGAEQAAGSDPESADSDGDTYLDGWEVAEGKDPADEGSRIYQGYWPYNPDKMDDSGFDGSTLEVGEIVGNHVGRDQFGDKVELFDFLGQGKDVLIDASAQWCGPCQVTALWISSGGTIDYYGYESEYGDLRKAIDSGDLLWVTIIVENNNYDAPTGATVQQWDEDFPHERVPVIVDTDANMMDAIINWTEDTSDDIDGTGFFPSGMLLSSGGKVLKVGGMDQVMDMAQSRL